LPIPNISSWEFPIPIPNFFGWEFPTGNERHFPRFDPEAGPSDPKAGPSLLRRARPGKLTKILLTDKTFGFPPIRISSEGSEDERGKRHGGGDRDGKVDIRLPGKGNSNSHGTRPVY